MDTALPPEQADTQATDPMVHAAHCLACGPWLLAFDLEWITGISEAFSLHPIPRTPSWLVGCTNTEGLLVPVVDMLQLIDPQERVAKASRPEKARLLFGSHSPGENEEAIGLLFTDLPQQISYLPEALPPDMSLPPMLKALALNLARSPDGLAAVQVDTRRLIDLCISQLDTADALLVSP